MFRYVLALLFVTYSSSSVIPPAQPSNGTVAIILANLTLACENKFLSSQIKASLDFCNVQVPPYDDKEFECMIFYDINNRLCDAVSKSKLALANDDYLSAINKEINVADLCEEAKSWTFGKITEFPEYEKTVAGVYNNKISCVKVCGAVSVLSQDTNYYCKYYKWGLNILQMLKNQTVAVSDVKVDPPQNALVVDSVNNNTNNEILESQDINVHPDVKTQNKAKELPVNLESKNASTQPANLQSLSTKQFDLNNAAEQDDKNELEVVNPINEKQTQPKEANNAEIERPSAGDIELEDTKNEKEVNEAKEKLPDEKKLGLDMSDDYQDPNDLSEGGDDGDDDVDGRQPAPPPNNINNKEIGVSVDNNAYLIRKSSPRYIVFPVRTTTKDSSPMKNKIWREKIVSAPYQESYTDDDNDHFFSFFLTAVVLVVLIYVLYHNKNKVSKVFLGLIVEGRQPGRRRNSRGHAYRRLDTLEQAITTDSAAPPTKIIY